MAFRTGSYVASLADQLSPSNETSESWTYVVPDAKESEAQAILEEFHEAEVSCIRIFRSPGMWTTSDDVTRASPWRLKLT